MLRKKLACLFLALSTLLQPFSAQAVDLGAAFTNLVGPDAAYSLQKPGRFQSSARGGFTGGAARRPKRPDTLAKVPNNNA